MKGLPYIMIGLVVLVAAALFLNLQSPVGPAIAQAQLGIASPSMAAATSGLGSTFLKVVGVAVAIILLVAAWPSIKRWATGGGRWKSGPNARWQRQEEMAPRQGMSLDDALKYKMIQSMTGGQSLPPVSVQKNDEDKLEF